MSFPVEPHPEDYDERGLFLVQDPAIRSRVLPLFSFDPRAADQRPRGHGTMFRIDPWSRCATAYHVMEDLFVLDPAGERPVLRPDLRLAALELEGLAFGVVPLPPDAWRPISDSYALCGIENEPFCPPRMRNVTELVVIRVRQSQRDFAGTPYFPVDLRRWHPSIGEHVQALGFADLDVADGSDDRPIAQYLYGSIGEITDIEPADGRRARPWPVIRVAAEWSAGMSGGPVFNEAGHVIGVVSSGIGGSGVGTATCFSGWDMPERIFGSLDPDNPGCFICCGVFDAAGCLVYAGQDRSETEQIARQRSLTDLGLVSINPQSGDYMRR